MIHSIKVKPPYYSAIIEGKKNFELRKDDRNYQVGDVLYLCEFDGENYTGKQCIRRVTYKLSDFVGLASGYCILGLSL